MTNVLIPLILVLSLTACSTMAPVDPITKTETEYIFPPSSLLAPCPVPEYTGSEWQHVADYAVLLKGKLEQCNKDKAAMREDMEAILRLEQAD